MPTAPAAPLAVTPPPGMPPLPPPKPPPAPTREIKLGAPAIDPGVPQTPPKPGSARERISQSLRAKAGMVTPTPPPAAPAAPTPPEPPAEPPATPPETPPATPPEVPATPAPPATPDKPVDKTKANPWKIIDQWKGKVTELEKRLAEASNLPEQKQKEYITRIEELQKHNERLENEIRFVNYSESEEFKSKYQAPYEAAWKRAMSELSEITITDPNTQAARAATAQDLAELLSVPLTKARELANQYFGDFADDIMGFRKELRALFDARETALKEAKEKGLARDKERAEIIGKHREEIGKFIHQTWEKAVQEMAVHPKYGKFFTPVEGDQDGNQRLAKGYELVDRAFNETPNDPNLTPEQRAGIVKRHAAVRNRAAAFGRLVSMIDKLTAEKEQLTSELAQYKGSTPPTGGSSTPPTTTPPAAASARERIFAELHKRAH